MKSLAALFITISCTLAAHAQSTVGPNGPNGNDGTQGSNDNGRAYSNGYIPSPYEQNQNRPDSTLRSDDTTYMHQQWNGHSDSQTSDKNKKKRSTSTTTTQKTSTTSTKKKK